MSLLKTPTLLFSAIYNAQTHFLWLLKACRATFLLLIFTTHLQLFLYIPYHFSNLFSLLCYLCHPFPCICDSKLFFPSLSMSDGPSYVVLSLPRACLMSPSVRGNLALCRHPPRSVICCWWLWRIRGSGPWGSLFVWAVCSQSLQSWQKSFMAKHIVCSLPRLHTNHSCSFTFPVLGRCRCAGGKFAPFPPAKPAFPVCVSMSECVRGVCVFVCLCTKAIKWAC